MKKLFRFIFLSYIGTFLITFCIAVFIFLMNFIFVYIDDFIGKNFGITTILKLFYYFSLNTVPRALPLSILLSSIMVIGNLSEHFEISAMKSAGISFSKITRPIYIFTIFAILFVFLFSNFVLPNNNLKLQTLLMSIRSTKPALLFKPGVFNNEIGGYSMRFGKIENDGKSIEDILMYDHSNFNGNTTVVYAERGKINELNQTGELIFTLYNGSSYKEITDSNEVMENHDFIREIFEERTFRFDLKEFSFRNLNEGKYKTDYDVLNIWQMQSFIDSVKKENLIKTKKLNSLKELQSQKDEIVILNTTNDSVATQPFSSKNIKDEIEYLTSKIETSEYVILKYTIEWHKRMASSFACLILFLIGAPLGYIIKKGGLGMPIVVSVILYILYHTISITGEKLAEDGSLSSFQGVWLSTIIILPIGIFLFYKAAKDRIEFNFEWRNYCKKR